MKHRPSVVVAMVWALGAAVPAMAQYSRDYRSYVGIAGGATVSNLWARVDFSSYSTSNRWGWTAGGFVGRQVSARTGLMLEVNWSQLGGGGIRMDYINIPLTFGGILTSGMLQFRPYLGLSIDFLQAYHNSMGLFAYNPSKSTQWTMPLGATIGLGTAGGGVLGLDVRYAVPLTNAFEITEVNNRSWLFRLVVAKGVGQRLAQAGAH